MIRSPTDINASSPGVVVDDHSIRFVASQPWLFPRSLLLGFTAEAADDTIDVDQDELEDAAHGSDVVLVDTSRFGSFHTNGCKFLCPVWIEVWFAKLKLNKYAHGLLPFILRTSGRFGLKLYFKDHSHFLTKIKTRCRDLQGPNAWNLVLFLKRIKLRFQIFSTSTRFDFDISNNSLDETWYNVPQRNTAGSEVVRSQLPSKTATFSRQRFGWWF